MAYIVDLTAIAEHQARLGEGERLMLAIAERLETIADALNDLSNTVEAIHHDIRSPHPHGHRPRRRPIRERRKIMIVRRTADGMLDLSICPRCSGPTYGTAGMSGNSLTRTWWCEPCDGWWQQVGYRDATWIPAWIPSAREVEGADMIP